jgi:alpha-glucoside transport system substrate-binding protein
MKLSRYRIPLLLLVLALAAPLVAAVAAVAQSSELGPPLRVLGPWTGIEEDQFRQVLDKFTADTGIAYDYQGTRAVSQVLLAEIQRGAPPDVAVLPSPGELARHAGDGHLTPLDGVLDEKQLTAYGSQWRQLLRLGKDTIYVIPVKASLKSLIWFNPKALPDRGQLSTLADLTELAKQRATDGVGPAWCLGLAAPPSSGWPGTDWIEEILLRQEGTGLYHDWVTGDLDWTSEPVKRAWTTWGTLVSPANRSAAALLTDFGDAGRGMYDGEPSCLLDHQASFIMTSYQGYGPGLQPGDDFDFVPFPDGPADQPSARVWEVSADLAGLFKDTPEGRQLMAFLASAEGQEVWPGIQENGENGENVSSAFSVNRDASQDIYRDAVRQRIAKILASQDTFCFDGSDLMPASVRSAFERAVLEYVSNPKYSTERTAQKTLEALLGRLQKLQEGVPPREWTQLSCWSSR